MNQQKIPVSSITYALKGRDLLRSMGFKAYMERSKGGFSGEGCGYSIYVDKDFDRAVEILREHHIRMVGPLGGEG